MVQIWPQIGLNTWPVLSKKPILKNDKGLPVKNATPMSTTKGLQMNKGLPVKTSWVWTQIGGTIGAWLPNKKQIEQAKPFIQEQIKVETPINTAVETTKPKTDYTLSKVDIIEKAKREHPRLQEWLDIWDITEDDIFSKVLLEHPKIKVLHDQWEIDMGEETDGNESMEQDVWQIATDVVGAAYDSVTWLPRFIAENLSKWIGWIAKELWADQEKVDTLVWSYISSLSDFSGEAMGANKENVAYKGTKLLGDLAQIANPAWLGKLGIKAWWVAGKIAKEWSLISNVAKWATQAAVDTAVMIPQSEQRMAKPWELALWATIWWAIPAVWAAYQKWKEWLWKLGQKIYAKTIKLTPSQIKKITKPNIAWTDPERWLLDRKITGSLDDIQNKLDDIASTSYKTLNEKVANVPWEFKSEAGDKILNALKKKVTGIEWLEEITTKIDDLLSKWKKGYSLKDMFTVKRLLDKRIKLYWSSGDPIAQETVEWLRNLRENLRSNIDEISKNVWLDDVRSLSKDIQVSTEISNALDNTINREASNRAMSLTDLLVWWSLGAGVLAGTWDPRDAIKVVGWTLITKKVLENPAIRTKIAVQLDKLAPKIKQELTEHIIDKTPLSKMAQEMIRKAITQASVKGLSPKQE